MIKSLQRVDIPEASVRLSYPVWDAAGPTEERTTDAGIFDAEGTYTERFYPDFRVGYGKVDLRRTITMRMEQDWPSVTLYFCLRGCSETEEDGNSNRYVLTGGEHNIYYSNVFRGVTTWHHNNLLETLEISFNPKKFVRMLPGGNPLLMRFCEHIATGRSMALGDHNLPITPRMMRLLREIIAAEPGLGFPTLSVQSSVYELLRLQLEQLLAHDCDQFCSLNQTDVARIRNTREYLLNNLDAPMTLNELALRVGTNEYTLKLGFRELYGTTVFRFWREVKMEEAMRLLLRSEPVKEVANTVGYKHAHHFSKAFKRRFGVVPSQVDGSIL